MMLLSGLLLVVGIWLFIKLVQRVLGDSLNHPNQGGNDGVPPQALRPQPKPKFAGFEKKNNPATFGGAFNAPTLQPPPAPKQEPLIIDHEEIQPAGLTKDLPANFDEARFLEQAKQFFIRMQGVFDQPDKSKLADYCTDDVVDVLYATLKSQKSAQAGGVTSVQSLEAELIGFELDVDEEIASVVFTGLIRGDENQNWQSFSELWTLIHPLKADSGWLLAGIHSV